MIFSERVALGWNLEHLRLDSEREHIESMKGLPVMLGARAEEVASGCEKARELPKRCDRGYPKGETRPGSCRSPVDEYIVGVEGTARSETSQ